MEKPNQLDIDKVINRLIQNPNYPMVYQTDIRAVCFKARQIMLSQPIFLQLKAPIKVCGDIHGQFHDLVKIFQTVGYPDSTSFLFIGDYVDRGKQSIQSIMLLLAYKIKYPQTFYLLRGNHESSSVNRLYGFYDECKRKFNLKIWKLFNDIFNTIPICARIQQKILCMHGGLSPQLENFRQISSISRPVEAPDQGLICDILWSDPQKMAKGWQKNHQRGISYTFGYDVLQLFMKKHNIDLICRAHQVVEQGYQFFGNRKLVTIFSAPNYCGQFDNHGAVMNVDAQLVCSFDIIQAYRKKKM